MASPRALLAFAEANRSHVLAYSVARVLVDRCIAARTAADPDPRAARWDALHAIVASTALSALQGANCTARRGPLAAPRT